MLGWSHEVIALARKACSSVAFCNYCRVLQAICCKSCFGKKVNFKKVCDASFRPNPPQIIMSTSAPKINVRFWYVCGYWFSATQKCILHKGIIKENWYIWIHFFFEFGWTHWRPHWRPQFGWILIGIQWTWDGCWLDFNECWWILINSQ